MCCADVYGELLRYAISSLQEFDVETMITVPASGATLYHFAAAVAPNIVYYLPRNIKPRSIARLFPFVPFEFEELRLNRKLKAICIYWGDLFSEDQE